MKQEPSFFGFAHPDVTMRDRLIHAGAGISFGFIAGTLIFVVLGLGTLSAFLFCICVSMFAFGLIGFISPKSLVDSFIKSIWLLP